MYPYIRLNLIDSAGSSILHIAVKTGSVELVKLLIDAGTDIDVQDVYL